MLVLRRRVGEAIVVGGEVEIEVIEISRSRVQLGVRAPFHVPVIRKETRDVARENRLASDLVASRGHKGVGELLQVLNRPASNEPALSQESSPPPSADGTSEAPSNKMAGSRYESPERYSGHHEERENPHPAR
jgi:carbon storage regulator